MNKVCAGGSHLTWPEVPLIKTEIQLQQQLHDVFPSKVSNPGPHSCLVIIKWWVKKHDSPIFQIKLTWLSTLNLPVLL